MVRPPLKCHTLPSIDFRAYNGGGEPNKRPIRDSSPRATPAATSSSPNCTTIAIFKERTEARTTSKSEDSIELRPRPIIPPRREPGFIAIGSEEPGPVSAQRQEARSAQAHEGGFQAHKAIHLSSAQATKQIPRQTFTSPFPFSIDDSLSGFPQEIYFVATKSPTRQK
ncbi:unnamed protein product [Linum trigynum]|uniref:Uncharacterized protein n=1 Tax=Linum trigynum TaxID=586398 RepID=A0AAV2DAK8_9ROSI